MPDCSQKEGPDAETSTCLQATGYDLEQSVGLFFASHGDEADLQSHAAPSDSRASTQSRYNTLITCSFTVHEAHMHKCCSNAAKDGLNIHPSTLSASGMCCRGPAAVPDFREEAVRAPLPVLRERLYGEVPRGGSSDSGQRPRPVQAFRDFK